MRNPDIILGPVITEKSVTGNQNGVYTFKVAKSATKTQIKSEIERHFGVKVLNVNTLNTKPKDRRIGKYTGKTKTYKKAIVTLAQGSSIEM
ncbi:50S ribosomal protein L23 [bacterium]|uniref:50S ribosomal protein L23 n=1 Tax=Candidatus Ventrenecus sp. TaxID=3085654 RepID=UPI001D4C1EF6|nr:50S ribosomal protein L23 [bacterium]